MIEFKFPSLDALVTLSRPERVRAAAHRALVDEAEGLADAIREAAPSDKGDLRDSVRVEPTDNPLRVVVTAGGTPGTIETNKDGVQFDEALMIEYGTTRSDAQPFFWPTIEQRRGKMQSNINGAMMDAAEN